MAYLDEHGTASAQYRIPRREVISGVVVVHTAESVMDDIGPDTGAENVAAYMTRRSDPGSYHEMGDSDSVVALVPDHAEAFQVAADGHNRHAWGFSFACRSTDLHPDSDWTRRAMAIAGPRIAGFWERHGFCPEHSARWLDNGEVARLRSTRTYCAHGLRQGGLVTHGQLQPRDRSDAWTTHRHRQALEQLLVDAIRPITPAPPPEEDDDMKVIFVRGHSHGEVIQCDGTMVPKVVVPSEEYLADVAYLLRTETGAEIISGTAEEGYVDQVGVPVRLIDNRLHRELLAIARGA